MSYHLFGKSEEITGKFDRWLFIVRFDGSNRVNRHGKTRQLEGETARGAILRWLEGKTGQLQGVFEKPPSSPSQRVHRACVDDSALSPWHAAQGYLSRSLCGSLAYIRGANALPAPGIVL